MIRLWALIAISIVAATAATFPSVAAVSLAANPEVNVGSTYLNPVTIKFECKSSRLAEHVLVDDKSGKNDVQLSVFQVVKFRFGNGPFPLTIQSYSTHSPYFASRCWGFWRRDTDMCVVWPVDACESISQDLASTGRGVATVCNLHREGRYQSGGYIYADCITCPQVSADFSLAHFSSDTYRVVSSVDGLAVQAKASPHEIGSEQGQGSLNADKPHGPTRRVGGYLLGFQVASVVLVGLLLLIGGGEVTHRVWEAALDAEIGIGSRNPRPWKAFALYSLGGFLMLGSVLAAMIWGAWWIT